MPNQPDPEAKRIKSKKKKPDRLEQGHLDDQPKSLSKPFNGLPLGKLPDMNLIK